MSIFGKLAKSVKKAAKTVSKGATSVAHTVSHGATSTAHTVAHGATSAVHTIGHGAASAAKNVAHGMSDAERELKHSEILHTMGKFNHDAQSAIGHAVQSGVHVAGNAVSDLAIGVNTVVMQGYRLTVGLEHTIETYVRKGLYELSAHPGPFHFCSNLVRTIQQGNRGQRLHQEVLVPFSHGHFSGEDALRRASAILGMDPRHEARMQGLGSCLSIGLGADGGLVVGGGAGLGMVIDLKGGPVKGYGSLAGGIGVIIKVGGGIEVSWAPCASTDAGGAAVGIQLGGKVGIGLSAAVATPLTSLTDPDSKWSLDSITFGVGVGAGADAELYIDNTWLF